MQNSYQTFQRVEKSSGCLKSLGVNREAQAEGERPPQGPEARHNQEAPAGGWPGPGRADGHSGTRWTDAA